MSIFTNQTSNDFSSQKSKYKGYDFGGPMEITKKGVETLIQAIESPKEPSESLVNLFRDYPEDD